MKAFKIRQGLSANERVFIKSFPGAKNECMSDYIKPSLKYTPDVVILHCGTNDFHTAKNPDVISSKILNLVNEMKNDNNEIIVCGKSQETTC